MKKNKSFLAYPYIIWSALFIVIPLILMVAFSFTIEDGNKIVSSLDNYQRLMNPIYLKVFLRS
ncbi:MAG: ABC transporter permease, partial [Clostridiales bacterium]|nr:ABC transporter permease [Clostridiales bacterium]